MKELLKKDIYLDRENRKFIVHGKKWPTTQRNYEAILNDELEKLSDIVLDFN